MREPLSTSNVEIAGIQRVAGLDTTLRVELTADGQRCEVMVRRCLNPALFDFMAKHATTVDNRAAVAV